jgi:hypothetical protein
VQGFPLFCLHDKVPSGEFNLKVLISAKAGCSALFSPILLAKSLTFSSVQGLLSMPRHFKAPNDPWPLAVPWESEFVLRSVCSCSRFLAALSEVVLVVGCVVAFVVGCVVGCVAGCVVDFVVGCVVGVDFVCPIICKAAAKHSTTVAIMVRFIGVFLLYPSVSSRQ